MAMTRRLWSINALATEFSLDRRTVALRIKDVPPAGKVRGHDGYRLADVIDAILPQRRPPPPGAPNDPVLEGLVERVTEWRELYQRDDGQADTGRDFEHVTINDFAALIGADPADVLRWLRAGMPYHVRGDFETGDGFTIRAAHAIDWVGLVYRAAIAGDAVRYICDALRLPAYLRRR